MPRKKEVSLPAAEDMKPIDGGGRRKRSVAVLIILLALIGTGAAAWYYQYYSRLPEVQERRVLRENMHTLESARRLMILPEADTPVIYDIQDPVLLTNQQTFFAGSQKGDKLIIYPRLGKAVIYSPARNVIVNVGPISFTEEDVSGAAEVGAPTQE